MTYIVLKVLANSRQPTNQFTSEYNGKKYHSRQLYTHFCPGVSQFQRQFQIVKN